MADSPLVSLISPKSIRALPANFLLLNHRNRQSTAAYQQLDPCVPSSLGYSMIPLPDEIKASLHSLTHHFHNITLHKAKASQELLTLSSLQSCLNTVVKHYLTQLLPKTVSLCLQHRKHQQLQPPPPAQAPSEPLGKGLLQPH